MTTKVLIVTNTEWYFLSHRVPLARALRDAGHQVVVVAESERGAEAEIERLGFRFIRIPLDRRGSGLRSELKTLRALRDVYRTERPWAVHHITIKPVIYGSMIARLLRIPVIMNTIPGLGYMFTGTGFRGLVRRLVAFSMYRFALGGKSVRSIFQNPQDRALFVQRRIVGRDNSSTVLGSGVDLVEFSPAREASTTPVVVLPARLLWDKGVAELVEASKLLKIRGVDCRIALVGSPDPQNPSSVPESTLRGWVRDGIVEWWGQRADMPAVLRDSHIVVLPSYREGVPKSLLEAAASARAIVATDVPGCREVVDDGVTGILVPPRDAVALADAIQRLVARPELRRALGEAARKKAVEKFSDKMIAAQTVAAYPTIA
ncbi:MAG: glycosyltransferase family 4 protein [Gemmatimonadaceae bacterium]